MHTDILLLVGDAALAAWDVALAAECFTHANDLGSLLLVYSSTSDREGLASLASKADEAGSHNVSFSAKWLLGDVEGCVDTLVKTGRLAEAALFAQTYKPSLAPSVVKQWKENLEKNKKARVAKTIAAPPADGEGDEELFPEWEEYLRLEKDGGAVADGDVEMADETVAEAEEEAAQVAEEVAEAEEAEAEAEEAEAEAAEGEEE